MSVNFNFIFSITPKSREGYCLNPQVFPMLAVKVPSWVCLPAGGQGVNNTTLNNSNYLTSNAFG